MAKKDVVRLLVRLFGSPKLHGNYRKNPDQVLTAAGLSPKERALLKSGDEKAIRAYLGTESSKANVVKSGLANVVKSAAKKTAGPNMVKTALGPNVVKTALGPNVVKTAIKPTDTTKKKPK
jgi:hypothetical protein